MGAGQSTRKITVINDEATGVIKISDSVVDRLKGEISGTASPAAPAQPPSADTPVLEPIAAREEPSAAPAALEPGAGPGMTPDASVPPEPMPPAATERPTELLSSSSSPASAPVQEPEPVALVNPEAIVVPPQYIWFEVDELHHENEDLRQQRERLDARITELKGQAEDVAAAALRSQHEMQAANAAAAARIADLEGKVADAARAARQTQAPPTIVAEELPPLPAAEFPPPPEATIQQVTAEMPARAAEVWHKPIVQYVEEPSLSALRVKEEKEVELKHLERHYKKRLQDLQEEHTRMNSLYRSTFTSSAAEVETLFSKSKRAPVCAVQREAVKDCYLRNSGQPIVCSPLVKALTTCARTARLVTLGPNGG